MWHIYATLGTEHWDGEADSAILLTHWLLMCHFLKVMGDRPRTVTHFWNFQGHSQMDNYEAAQGNYERAGVAIMTTEGSST